MPDVTKTAAVATEDAIAPPSAAPRAPEAGEGTQPVGRRLGGSAP